MMDYSHIDRSILRSCDKYCGMLYVDDDDNRSINLDNCGNCPYKMALKAELEDLATKTTEFSVTQRVIQYLYM